MPIPNSGFRGTAPDPSGGSATSLWNPSGSGAGRSGAGSDPATPPTPSAGTSAALSGTDTGPLNTATWRGTGNTNTMPGYQNPIIPPATPASSTPGMQSMPSASTLQPGASQVQTATQHGSPFWTMNPDGTWTPGYQGLPSNPNAYQPPAQNYQNNPFQMGTPGSSPGQTWGQLQSGTPASPGVTTASPTAGVAGALGSTVNTVAPTPPPGGGYNWNGSTWAVDPNQAQAQSQTVANMAAATTNPQLSQILQFLSAYQGLGAGAGNPTAVNPAGQLGSSSTSANDAYLMQILSQILSGDNGLYSRQQQQYPATP